MSAGCPSLVVLAFIVGLILGIYAGAAGADARADNPPEQPSVPCASHPGSVPVQRADTIDGGIFCLDPATEVAVTP
jgi:hypothetical protein